MIETYGVKYCRAMFLSPQCLPVRELTRVNPEDEIYVCDEIHASYEPYAYWWAVPAGIKHVVYFFKSDCGWKDVERFREMKKEGKAILTNIPPEVVKDPPFFGDEYDRVRRQELYGWLI